MVDVVAQGFGGGPDGPVDDDEGIVVIGKLGGVAGRRSIFGLSGGAMRRPILI